MATQGEQEVEEYESDPEEVKRSLGMRRREAASDDEEEGEGNGKRAQKHRTEPRPPIHSDESDGQGGAAEYDDDVDEISDEEVDEEEVEEEEEEVYDDDEGEEIDEEDGREEGEGKGSFRADGGKEVISASGEVTEGHGRRNVEQAAEERPVAEGGEEEEVEKKENEPYAVPTAGAFYMHDDRFKAKGNVRHSR